MRRRIIHDGYGGPPTGAQRVFDFYKLRVGTALMLMLAYGAGVGGLLTPVGTPPNIIGRRLMNTRRDVTSASWNGVDCGSCRLLAFPAADQLAAA